MNTLTKQIVYLPVKGFKTPAEEEGYFFTPEQLNEYTANVIKQALENAVEKVEHEEYKFDGKQPSISKQSITNTFDETFNKFKV